MFTMFMFMTNISILMMQKALTHQFKNNNKKHKQEVHRINLQNIKKQKDTNFIKINTI